jgi:hypothetical protein
VQLRRVRERCHARTFNSSNGRSISRWAHRSIDRSIKC